MKEFKNMKFRINSKEEDEKLQKYLFSLGYEDRWGEKSYFCEIGEYNKFLYTLITGKIGWGYNEICFTNHPYPEYTLEELITYELKEVEKEFEQFEVFDKLIELNKKGRNDFPCPTKLDYMEIFTVTFNCGRRKGHTSYIKSRFNPETDIICVLHDWFKTHNYENIDKTKIHNIKNLEWMKGYNFNNIKNIWIDDYSILESDEIYEFYDNLVECLSKNFDKNLTIIGVG